MSSWSEMLLQTAPVNQWLVSFSFESSAQPIKSEESLALQFCPLINWFIQGVLVTVAQNDGIVLC